MCGLGVGTGSEGGRPSLLRVNVSCKAAPASWASPPQSPQAALAPAGAPPAAKACLLHFFSCSGVSCYYPVSPDSAL